MLLFFSAGMNNIKRNLIYLPLSCQYEGKKGGSRAPSGGIFGLGARGGGRVRGGLWFFGGLVVSTRSKWLWVVRMTAGRWWRGSSRSCVVFTLMTSELHSERIRVFTNSDNNQSLVVVLLHKTWMFRQTLYIINIVGCFSFLSLQWSQMFRKMINFCNYWLH